MVSEFYIIPHDIIINMNGVHEEDWTSLHLYDILSGKREVSNWLGKRRLMLNF